MIIIKCDKLNSRGGRGGDNHPAPFNFFKKKVKLCQKSNLFCNYTLFWKNLINASFIEKKSLKLFSHFMLLLNQFKCELLYYVSLLSNYSIIEFIFFEKPLPCPNENWGYNLSSTSGKNEYKNFPNTSFFLLPF